MQVQKSCDHPQGKKKKQEQQQSLSSHRWE